MNLNRQQEAALENFEAAYGAYRDAERELHAEIRREYESRLAAKRRAASLAGSHAVWLGVPLRQLGAKDRAGMRTTSYASIHALLDETWQEVNGHAA